MEERKEEVEHVFALPNLIFLTTNGPYLEYGNEWASKERFIPFLITSLSGNTLEQWGHYI